MAQKWLKHSSVSILNSDPSIKIGFVPLVDCAPLVVAFEKGWFTERGINVELVREFGWASIRDKIVCDELDAAHAPAGFCFGIPWGLGTLKRDCLTSFLFNSNGNSIVIHEDLLNQNQKLTTINRPIKLAVPHVLSSHHFLLRQWLRPLQMCEGKDFEVITLSPQLMVESLQANFIDGFCVGEPFGSLAVSRKVGRIIRESAELSPEHPEKALLVTGQFAKHQNEIHLNLIACLIRAAQFCDTKAGRIEAAEILSGPRYLDLPQKLIEQSLLTPSNTIESEDFHIFNQGRTNEPTSDKANWIINHMRSSNLIPESMTKADLRMEQIFCSNTYQEARQLV